MPPLIKGEIDNSLSSRWQRERARVRGTAGSGVEVEIQADDT
jgi:hypothetical protein